MVKPKPILYRKGKPKLSSPAARPPAVALQLTAASYSNFSLTLSFDRAIDLGSFNPSAIYVNDADRSMALQGGGEYALQDDQTLVMSMEEIGDYEGGSTVLTAGNATGIVAIDDGGTWAGTGGTELPFP